MIGLIARREVRERLRRRSFQVTTLVSLVIVAAAIVGPKALAGDRPAYDVAFTTEAPALAVRSVEAVAASVDVDVRIRPAVAAAEADARVRDGSLDLVVGEVEVVAARSIAPGDTSRRSRFATGVAAVVALQQGLADAGLDADASARALSNPPLPVRGLAPAPADRGRERSTALGGVLLLFFFLNQYGSWILLGVIEEKSSRVVEVLLAAVRPTQLLVGKVLGIGAVALGQGLLTAAVALGAATATGSDVLSGARLGLVGLALLWFLVGYALYASLYAAAGSLATRAEDAQNAAFPVTVPLIVGYLAAASAIAANESPLAVTVLSWLPPTAPLAMPARVAVGEAGAAEVAGSVALAVLTTVVLARVAAAVYRRSVLRTGAAISWAEALRSLQRPGGGASGR